MRAGLDVLLDRSCRSAVPSRPRTPSRSPSGGRGSLAPAAPSADQAAALELADFFDARRLQPVAGRAALVPSGGDTARVVRAAAQAGAAAVLVYGAPLPSGGLGLDERVPVPVVGIPEASRGRLSAALAAGRSVGVSIGAGALGAAAAPRRVAAFSSRGLAFDGRVKPELVAAGRRGRDERAGRERRTARPRYGTVNGSSASAARRGGPRRCSPRRARSCARATLKSVLVGSARPARADESSTAQGAGLLDVGRRRRGGARGAPATLALGPRRPAELARRRPRHGPQPLLAPARR